MILPIIYTAGAAILLLASLTYGFVFNFIACVAMAAATALVAILQWLSELKSMFRKTAGPETCASDPVGARPGEKVISIPPFRSAV